MIVTHDMHARAPVDRVAARVIRPGIHFTSPAQPDSNDSTTPLKTTPITLQHAKSDGFVDLTGTQQGRLIVIGLSAEKSGLWVARCQCGTYVLRRARSLKAPTNPDGDSCESCNYLMKLKHFDPVHQTNSERTGKSK